MSRQERESAASYSFYFSFPIEDLENNIYYTTLCFSNEKNRIGFYIYRYIFRVSIQRLVPLLPSS